MKRKLLLAASLVIAGLSAQAQRINCGLTLAKSGTGTNRTYTLGSGTTIPASGMSLRIYPTSGVTQSGTSTTTRTVGYLYGGIYTLYLEAPNYCNDSVVKTDTVMGPMDCANTGAYLQNYIGTASTRTFGSGLTGAGLAPGYTATTTYNYGDGTSGTSSTHTYMTAGSYTATVTIVCTHPSFPSCTKTETRLVYIPYGSCGSTLSKSGTGLTRTYAVQTNAVNPTFNASIQNFNFNYQVPGSNSSFTYTYPQSGYYEVRVAVAGTGCQDSLALVDTVIGPLNCAALTHSLSAYSSGLYGYFYPSGTATASYPGYTRNISYNYGDGTTGSSTNHLYAASGSYLVTATTTLTNPTYGSCTVVDTATVQITLPPNRIYANALWDSSMNAAGASVKFWLIQYDSTSQMLTAVDSALVAVTNGYNASTIFNNKPAGSYRVKAHMLNQPAAWTTHLLPTYSASAAYWQYASVINHTGATSYGNVFMQQGAAVSGPGFIGGLVTQGANKGASTGDPMANKMIFLRDLYGAPVATTLTNGAGQYQFTNLPYGTYTVYPEEINYTTTPSQPITLDAAQPNAQGYNFRQELIARTFDPYFVPAAVRHTSTPGGIELFPNPAQHTLYIRLGSSVISGSLQLFNLTGQLVKTQPVDAAQELQAIATDGLANGTYLLHIPTAEGRQVYTISIRK
ncbi:MAG: T9SS type A sorting domain-containing protein [Sphingobacteriales bacterium]|nr:MAG: T9SS type A sorting domain-containing protein [Sphingobacteriales bacterium]